MTDTDAETSDGDGDGDMSGDGDGDGDGDMSGDGDGDMSGDGDGDMSGDGDGDPAGGCGDGVVDGVEECDLGEGQNADDAACTSMCLDAVCGDGLVWAGSEDCDDGNDDETDACTTLCVAPACDDMILSGDETNIDCGGSCDGCDFGQACLSGDDCNTGVCDGGQCDHAATCAGLNDASPGLSDGLYLLDPDASGALPAYEAYCDMTTEGGGWTLVMKALEDNFSYDDPLWTDINLLAEDDFDFMTPATKAKYQAYTQVPFQILRTSDPDDFAADYEYDLGQQYASALELFSGPGIEISTELEPYFDDRVPDEAKQWGCTTYTNVGINQQDYLGLAYLQSGPGCDWNGGARFGQRVNADHNGTGDHAGQGWGAYSTIGQNWYVLTNQLLWVK